MFAYCGNNPILNVDPSGYLYAIHAGAVGEFRTYITDQTAEEIGDRPFGLANVAHGGCGIVASYNALITLRDSKDFEDILGYYNNHLALIPGKGLIGLSPYMIEQFFCDLGYRVVATNSPDLIDLYSKTASASILYYEFPATYWGIEAYGAHFVEYHKSVIGYVGVNTNSLNGQSFFEFPSDFGYKDSRYYAVGIFIYK